MPLITLRTKQAIGLSTLITVWSVWTSKTKWNYTDEEMHLKAVLLCEWWMSYISSHIYRHFVPVILCYLLNLSTCWAPFFSWCVCTYVCTCVCVLPLRSPGDSDTHSEVSGKAYFNPDVGNSRSSAWPQKLQACLDLFETWWLLL